MTASVLSDLPGQCKGYHTLKGGQGSPKWCSNTTVSWEIRRVFWNESLGKSGL